MTDPSDRVVAQLAEVAARLSRLVDPPLPQPLSRRLARAVLRWLPTRAAPDFSETLAFAQAVTTARRTAAAWTGSELERASLLERSVRELVLNVRAIERRTLLDGRPRPATLAAVWRQWQVITQLLGASSAPSIDQPDQLSLPIHTHALHELRSPDRPVPPLGVDAVMEAARGETRLLGRRRRLLEAARRMLLDANAALELEDAAVDARRTYLARSLARLDRFEAAGIRFDVALDHQLRQASRRRDLDRAFAIATALGETSVEAGAFDVGARTFELRTQLRARRPVMFSSASAAQSAREHLGEEVCRLVTEAYVAGSGQPDRLRDELGDELPDRAYEKARDYLDGGAGPALRVACTAGGSFEVGTAASPVRAIELNQRWRVVDWPTPELDLAPASGVHDLLNAVVDDPRLILLHLAEGKLLARRYGLLETQTRPRMQQPAEVRFYVLDGSGSMIGPRARMRDGLLINELATLIRRLEDVDRRVRPALYYKYFADKPGETRTVTTRQEAREAIGDVAATIRVGGTDIQGAMLAAFEEIRAAKQNDPDFAQAQLILVTDGDAPVDEDAVEKARQSVGDLPISISIVALGQENAALRRLAAHQRKRGERFFYQFVGDLELRLIEEGATAGLPLHLGAETSVAAQPADVLEGLASEIVVAADERLSRAAAQSDAEVIEAGFELGLGSVQRRELAGVRRDAIARDDRLVKRRFDRWFPQPRSAKPQTVDPGDTDDLIRVVAAISAITDVLDVAGVTIPPRDRAVDAIEVLQHVLLEAAVGPWRYDELVARYPAVVSRGLRAVRDAVGFVDPA